MLDAWRTLPGVTGSARLVLVPRHHERAGRLARRAVREGLRLVAWAEARTMGLEPGSTTIVDAPGALASVYASADVAIIGGSFARTGAHNVYEAARGGAAMIVGPEAGAMRVPIDELEAGGALTRVREASAAALGMAMARLLSNAERRAACASRAHAWLANRSGAAARTAADLLDMTERSRSRLTASSTCRETASRSSPSPSAGI